MVRFGPSTVVAGGLRGGAVRVGHAEQVVNGSQGAVGDLTGPVVAVVEDFVDVGVVVGQGGASLPQRAQEFVDGLGERLLEPSCAAVSDVVGETVRVLASGGGKEV
jgi:hypothetical protein